MTALTEDRALSGLAVSPAGRHVALFRRHEPSILLVDLVAHRSRELFFPKLPRNVLFAPSGRRLAVALTEGLAIVELGADPLAALDAHWRAVMDDEKRDDATFFDRIASDPRPQVTEWLVRQLEGRLDDPHLGFRVASAARALAKRRVVVDIERLKRARAKLPALRGGLRDYRDTIDRLVRTVESVARGERCECSVGFRMPAEHGHLEEISAERREGWGSFVYRCRLCGRRWRVVEDTSYHFPTYEISELTPSSEP